MGVTNVSRLFRVYLLSTSRVLDLRRQAARPASGRRKRGSPGFFWNYPRSCERTIMDRYTAKEHGRFLQDVRILLQPGFLSRHCEGRQSENERQPRCESSGCVE